MENDWKQKFSGKVRLRICGILIEENRILLVKHQGLGKAGFLWNPPGGGVQFGESYQETLKREFLEETNLEIEPGRFILFNEHIAEGIHAVELFFEVIKKGGDLKLGHDPELDADNQMMTELKYWSSQEIRQFPEFHFHKRLKEFFH